MIRVHQDGLVHISALSNTFVKDPHTVVKAGQVVRVKVLEVDEKRKRIALTMRLSDSAPQAGSQAAATRRPQRPQEPGPAPAKERRSPSRWRHHGGRVRQAARLIYRRAAMRCPSLNVLYAQSRPMPMLSVSSTVHEAEVPHRSQPSAL